MGIAATLAGMALPAIGNVVDSTKLNQAGRSVERELQSARLKAVSLNRSLRVRFNCPAAGQFRTVEVTGVTATDTDTNRCTAAAYPYPNPSDSNPATPQSDGPIHYLDQATLTGTNQVLEFRHNGTAYTVSGNSATAINGEVVLTVTRKLKTKVVYVNALGRIRMP